MITKVTITGADDSIKVTDLIEISKEFPFVEWGILLSRTSRGSNRFPSVAWLTELKKVSGLNLSAHLCGAYVREWLVGKNDFIETELKEFWPIFNRVQINTHAEPHTTMINKIIMFMAQWPTKQFIFQYDGVNNEIVHMILNQTYNGSTLFDLSHGAGLIPSEWPRPLDDFRCGYAGGLSPDNLKDNIEKIESIVGDTEIWIDMETHVRSNQDQLFDLIKVRKCLEISSDFIQDSRQNLIR